ncbi:MAG: sensor histidine kinase, partial [Burkholderiales bacterium]|nr:sensor histidine kinase [Burkholderiales bacterium]
LGDKLILARRVEKGNEQVVQCCWLDWEKIRRVLLEEVADVLPNARLEPITSNESVRIERALATLPAQIVASRA